MGLPDISQFSFHFTPHPTSLFAYLIYELMPIRWPRGLRHEPYSLTRTLGSCIQIPLKTWMSVYPFILCLCCPSCR
jgi:hypothetical protein